MAPGHAPTMECRISELLQSASTGQRDRIEEILDLGFVATGDVQWTPRRLAPAVGETWYGWGAQPGACALHCAAEAGHTATVALLLNRGADATQVTRHGVSALHLAAFGGHATIVAALLRVPAVRSLVDATCSDIFGTRGPTALHLACCASDDLAGSRCASLLLAARANVHASDASTYRRPLHYAAARASANLCRVLVKAGAWLQCTDAANQTPIMLARAKRDNNGGSPTTNNHHHHNQHDKAAAMAALSEMRWLPAVKLLWLGHLQPHSSSPSISATTTTAEEEDGSISSTGNCADDETVSDAGRSPLSRLTRDALRLLVEAVVDGHCGSMRPPPPRCKAEEDEAATTAELFDAAALGDASSGASSPLKADKTPPSSMSIEIVDVTGEDHGDAEPEHEDNGVSLAELALAVRTLHETVPHSR